jgi:hypothetical protein
MMSDTVLKRSHLGWMETAVEYKLVFKEEDFYVKAKDG